MHRDRTVMATLGGIRSPARTRAFFGRNLRHWEQYGFGLWIFRDTTDGRFVGRGGLRHVTLHGRPEVGYERDILYGGLPHVLYRRSEEFGGRRMPAQRREFGGLGGRPEPPNFK